MDHARRGPGAAARVVLLRGRWMHPSAGRRRRSRAPIRSAAARPRAGRVAPSSFRPRSSSALLGRRSPPIRAGRLVSPPPVTSTLPSSSVVACGPVVGAAGASVAVHEPLTGSNSSAEWPAAAFMPPTASTVPFASRLVVWSTRATSMSPVAVHVPVAGSYSSADTSGVSLASVPPATRTSPLDSSVAVCSIRPSTIEPVAVQVPSAGSYELRGRQGSGAGSVLNPPRRAPCRRRAAWRCGRRAPPPSGRSGTHVSEIGVVELGVRHRSADQEDRPIGQRRGGVDRPALVQHVR